MKGFPNQLNNLTKLSKALVVANDLAQEGKSFRDDGVYGEALIHAGVVGTGHSPKPVLEYLAEQNLKAHSEQPFRTTARGLRELFRTLGLMESDGEQCWLTASGKELALQCSGDPIQTPLPYWSSVIRKMSHYGNYGKISHPYQMLLRLVARIPGISRAKCALALEAKDDSPEELNRIVGLAAIPEADLPEKLGITVSTWKNAIKVLPSFAIQLGDLVQKGQTVHLATIPGGTSGEAQVEHNGKESAQQSAGPRQVTADAIATAGTADFHDEEDKDLPEAPTPEDLAARAAKLLNRLKRHNLIVKKVAETLQTAGAILYEHPFDCLAQFPEVNILIEVKSLSGDPADEVERVRSALGQLLYYEAFAINHLQNDHPVLKLALFELPITSNHAEWLRGTGIEPVWLNDGKFYCGPDAYQALLPYWGAEIISA